MMVGFYTAASGVRTHQRNMDVIANNIANVNTTGYKPLKTSFSELIYTDLNSKIPESEDLNYGHGVKVAKTDLVFQPGGVQDTQRDLDFAILDRGFFAVQKQNGEIEYTRNGSFSLSRQADDTYNLVDSDLNNVLDRNGQIIKVDIDEDMSYSIDPEQIGVFDFTNVYGLSQVGGSNFVATNLSGEAYLLENPMLEQGYLENSSVDMADEMSKAIVAQRSFQLSAKVISMTDELEQNIHNLRQ